MREDREFGCSEGGETVESPGKSSESSRGEPRGPVQGGQCWGQKVLVGAGQSGLRQGPQATMQRLQPDVCDGGKELWTFSPWGGAQDRVPNSLSGPRPLVSPWERAVSSMTAALISSKKSGTCVASARPSRGTRRW